MQKNRDLKSCEAFLGALADPYDSQALFNHLAGPVCRVPVSDLKELMARTRYMKRSLYLMVSSTDLTRAGEDIELDPEAWERAAKGLLDLARYEAIAKLDGRPAALDLFLNESGISGRVTGDDEARRELDELRRSCAA